MTTASPSVEAFAVDDTSVQLVWREAPAGSVRVEIDSVRIDAETSAGPGSLLVQGLACGRDHVAKLTFAASRPVEVAFTTLDSLPGEERCRIATISDLHLGLRAFGVRHTIRDSSTGESAGIRCARAALAEAKAWGADLLVVKGDLTNSGYRIEWRDAAELLHAMEVPVVVLPGNHEIKDRRGIDPWDAGEEFGLNVVHGVEGIDLTGIRVVLATTVIAGRSRGRIDHHAEEIVSVASEGPAALVTLHHHLEPGHLRQRPDPLFWPPGIPRSQADPFLESLAREQPHSLITSGHTHRHRRRQVGPITLTQVGSTKDYPGVWAGYTVHDGGIRQVVRRVAEPDCLRWTDRTRQAMAGFWGYTSPGRLTDRCFSIRW